jgi:hypothetical protein
LLPGSRQMSMNGTRVSLVASRRHSRSRVGHHGFRRRNGRATPGLVGPSCAGPCAPAIEPPVRSGGPCAPRYRRAMCANHASGSVSRGSTECPVRLLTKSINVRAPGHARGSWHRASSAWAKRRSMRTGPPPAGTHIAIESLGVPYTTIGGRSATMCAGAQPSSHGDARAGVEVGEVSPFGAPNRSWARLTARCS